MALVMHFAWCCSSKCSSAARRFRRCWRCSNLYRRSCGHSIVRILSQYLSFRTFVQLLAPTTTTKEEIVNLLLCLTVLFFTLFLAISFPALLCKSVLTPMFNHLNPKSYEFHCYSPPSLLLLGFCHAFLSMNCRLQLIMVLVLELLFVFVLVRLKKCLKRTLL